MQTRLCLYYIWFLHTRTSSHMFVCVYGRSEIWTDDKIYITLTPVAPVKPIEVSPCIAVWDASVKGQSHYCSRKYFVIGLETGSVSIGSQPHLDVG